MGNLTNDMTRLCGEIVALRGARHAFVKDLAHEVASMKAGFRRAHRHMAKQTKAERQADCSHLKHTVAGMRQAFAADIEGARRAWCGK